MTSHVLRVPARACYMTLSALRRIPSYKAAMNDEFAAGFEKLVDDFSEDAAKHVEGRTTTKSVKAASKPKHIIPELASIMQARDFEARDGDKWMLGDDRSVGQITQNFEDYVAVDDAKGAYNARYVASEHLLAGNHNRGTSFTRICGLAHKAIRVAYGETIGRRGRPRKRTSLDDES
eukprot:5243151-Pleurochrysis_carterae.AAC.1